MNLSCLVISEKKTFTYKQRWQACQAVAREYPAIGYLHTHQTTALGGKFAPHIHLLIAVPNERFERWSTGVKADLARRFAPSSVELSDPHLWVFDPHSPVGLLRYIIGCNRLQAPEPVYWTDSPFKTEQRALNALLNKALQSRAA